MYRRIIDIFFVYSIFEGLFRKLFFSGASTEIQVVRDLLPGLALIAFMMGGGASKYKVWPSSFVGAALLFYLFCGVLEFFNPASLAIAVGLLGLRTHFAYVPLMLLGPAYIRSPAEFRVRLEALCILIIPVVALGVVQTQLPSSDPLNANIDSYFGSRDLVRATGTFTYITGYGVICQFAVAAAMALLVIVPLASRSGLIAAIGGSAGFIGCLSSGSRAPVAGAALQLIIFMLLLLWSRSKTAASSGLSKIPAAAAVIGVVALTRAADLYEALRERAMENALDVNSRLESTTWGWIPVIVKYPFGNGIGMAHQQAGTVVGLAAGFLSGYEAELSRIAYELGAVGFLAFALFRISLLIWTASSARVTNSASDASMYALAFSTMALMLNGGVYTPMANSVFFLMAGLGIKKRQIARQTRPQSNIVAQPLFVTQMSGNN